MTVNPYESRRRSVLIALLLAWLGIQAIFFGEAQLHALD